MKRVVTLFLGLCFFVSLSAKVPTALFVNGNVSDADLYIIETQIFGKLAANTKLQMLERSQEFTSATDREFSYQYSGAVDSRTACKLGESFGASLVVAVVVVETRGTITVTAHAYMVRTGATVCTIQNHKSVSNYDELLVLGAMAGENISKSLTGKL